MTFRELCDLYLTEGVAHKKPSTIRSDVGELSIISFRNSAQSARMQLPSATSSAFD